MYNIPNSNICYLHGKKDSEIFFGHGNNVEDQAYNQANSVGSEGQLFELDEYLKKDTKEAYRQHSTFFQNLSNLNIENIYAYGFSFSSVDQYYLKKMSDIVDTDKVTWWFNNYHKTQEINDFKTIVVDCGFKPQFKTYHINTNRKIKLK